MIVVMGNSQIVYLGIKSSRRFL